MRALDHFPYSFNEILTDIPECAELERRRQMTWIWL